MAVSQTDTRVWKFTASGDAVSTVTFYRFLKWVGATSTSVLNVTDGSGNTVYSDEAATSNYANDCPLGYYISSLTVATMTDGTLFAYTGLPFRGIQATRDE